MHFNAFCTCFVSCKHSLTCKLSSALQIVLSDFGLAAALYVLYMAAQTWGWFWLIKVYVVPYLFVNFWLVTITYLQHTHPNLPHYEDDEWDWLRGALATVDRR
eukprot:GHRR01034790.1.p1 GENE.GHRR01034790.1~~GHRR01034790.1.p1  ORF type:complete len:103 (-),score=17.55 GHRR01034790.1:424-732(-)